MSEAIDVEVAVIGGGIAGASAAAAIAEHRTVLLLEREDQPGYHTSGRSAALFSEAYGNGPVRALSVASRAFLEAPPPGFAEHPLLTPRGALHVGAGAEQEAEIAAYVAETSRLVPTVRALSGEEARRLVPVLRPDQATAAAIEPGAQDIDTNGVLAGFLRLLRSRGGRLVSRAAVAGIERSGGRWRIETAAGTVTADIVVNAAGAWADEVAALAGLAPVGLEPKRRTAFLFEPPAGLDIRAWPLVLRADEGVYFKPDAGLLLGSPADETPSPPCDAQPEELDVAIAIDRIETLADLPVRRVVRRWAGLRTFAPDRTPVVGFDPRADGFFWLAGQGGYGFQTGPAMAACAAALIASGRLPDEVAAFGVAPEALSPARFR